MGDDAPEPKPWTRLVPVLDGSGEPGDYVRYAGVHLKKRDADRNLWDVYIDGRTVDTFDADRAATTVQIGRYVEQVAAADSAKEESGAESESPDPFPGSFR